MTLTVSLAPSGDLILALPDNERPLRVPADERGLATMLRILKAQALAPSGRTGTPTRPVQSLVEAWIAAGGRIEDEAERARERIAKRYGDEGLAIMDQIKLEI